LFVVSFFSFLKVFTNGRIFYFKKSQRFPGVGARVKKWVDRDLIKDNTSSMKRIIHMSDLHIGFENLADRFRALISSLIFEKSDKAGEYIIIITGDLVDDAHNATSVKVVQNGLDSLRKAGFRHILCVPGNHDYGTGNRGDRKFAERFKHAFFTGPASYPRLDLIDGVACIGLDSMAEELNWYDDLWAQGELGERQLEALERMLSSREVRRCNKRVVYLHHHPFNWRPLHQLKDSNDLRRVFQNTIRRGVTIDALLYGHNHEGLVHNGHWGIPRCYDAGTATFKERPRFVNWFPSYFSRDATRVIDIFNDDPRSDYELHLI
jgi:3',5'-cyclic AMP phosphodiesterase CpdA